MEDPFNLERAAACRCSNGICCCASHGDALGRAPDWDSRKPVPAACPRWIGPRGRKGPTPAARMRR